MKVRVLKLLLQANTEVRFFQIYSYVIIYISSLMALRQLLQHAYSEHIVTCRVGYA